jgi:hypothetical protein
MNSFYADYENEIEFFHHPQLLRDDMLMYEFNCLGLTLEYEGRGRLPLAPPQLGKVSNC